MLAPPLWAVRANYHAEYLDWEDFVEAIVGFVAMPKGETSLLPAAVRKYGLNAPLYLSEGQLRLALQRSMPEPWNVLHRLQNTKNGTVKQMRSGSNRFLLI